MDLPEGMLFDSGRLTDSRGSLALICSKVVSPIRIPTFSALRSRTLVPVARHTNEQERSSKIGSLSEEAYQEETTLVAVALVYLPLVEDHAGCFPLRSV